MKIIPGLGFFRFPEKFVAPASLLLCLAAALGIDAARRKPKALVVAALSAAAVALAFLLLLPDAESLASAGRLHSPAAAEAFHGLLRSGLVTSAALCAALAAAARFPPLAPALLAAGTLLVPRPYTADLSLYRLGERTARELEASAGKSPLRWRVNTLERSMYGASPDRRTALFAGSAAALMPRLNMLAGVESSATYSAVFDASYERLAVEAPAAFRRVFGVRFALLLPQDAPRGRVRRGPYGLSVRDYPESPRAWFAKGLTQIASEAEALANLRQGLDAVAGDLPKAGGGEVLRLSREAPEKIDAEVTTGTGGLLIVGEHYDPGWTARVDGKEQTVRAADLAALGVEVGPGSHRVELRFFPRGLIPGVLLALAALALFYLCTMVKTPSQS